MKRILANTLIAVIGMITACSPGFAQSIEGLVGQPTTAVTLPVERGFVNLQNGNLHIEIPFATYKGRGDLSTSLKMVYDSMIWHGVETANGYQWQPNNVDNSLGGWRFVSSLTGYTNSGAPVYNICGSNVSRFGPFTIGTLDGTQHTFPITTIQNPSPNANCTATDYPDTPTGTGYALDGSGFYAVVSNYDDIAMFDQNGAKLYDSANGAHAQVDRNGNYDSTTQDDLGRMVAPTVSYSADGTMTYYDVLTAYGQTERYTVTTETIQLNTNFLSDSVGQDFQGSMTVVKSIGLPDGSSYDFSYEAGSYGELSGITLPQQGTISYVYQSGLNGTRAGETVPPRWVSQHTGSNGETAFSIVPANCPNGVGQVGPCPVQHNYLTRNGSTTDYSFSLEDDSGYFNDYIYYHSGNQSSSILRTVAKTYNFNGFCPIAVCQGKQEYLYPNLATVANVFNDTLLTAYTSYGYDTPAVGIPTKVQQWDYYTSSASANPPYSPSSAPSRETDTVLGWSVNGALFPTSVKNSDSSGMLSETTLQYDDPGHITTPSSNPVDHDDSLVTGNRGNLTTVNRVLLSSNTQETTLFNYDTAGALQSITDPLAHQSSFSYDTTDTFVTQVTQPTTNNVQHTTHATYDGSTGQVLTQTDENQQLTQYAYDTYGRLHSVTAPSGAVTTMAYPSATETDIVDMQSSTVNVSSSVVIDTFGRPSQAMTGGISSETTYDGFGRMNCVTTPHAASAAATDGSTCNSAYDQFDRVQAVTQPDQNTVSLSYSDNVVIATDEVGHQHQYTFNAFGDLTAVVEQNDQGALAWETDYNYDGLDRLRNIYQKGDASTPAGWRTSTFNYDSLSRLTSQATPEGGTQTFSPYDSDDNLQMSTDARGETVQYSYDALDRLTQKALQNGDTYTYNYDATDTDQYGIGRLTSMFNGPSIGAYFYHDVSGNVISKLYCLPNNCSYNERMSATYDYHGNVLSETFPDGRAVYRNYDALDRVTQVGENSFFTQKAQVAAARLKVQPLYTRPRSYFSGASYLPAGELNSAVYGNVLQVTALFNNRQDITALSYTDAALQPLWSKSYVWDKNAKNLTTVTDGKTGTQRSFTYDNVNRLRTASDSTGNYFDSYTLDAWGNWKETGTYSFLPTSFTTGNQIAAAGYAYDLAGNLTADGLGNSYGFDANGKLSGSNGAVYTRDPSGERVRKDNGSSATEYYYFGGQLMATRDPVSNQWTDYIYAAGRLVAEAPSGMQDTVVYRIGDHLDSLVGKTDGSGNLLGTNDVSLYGELLSDAASDRLIFTQHERDGENASDYALYRQYASTEGRWLSPDPSGASYDLTDPQSLNRYAYLSGRPQAGVDSLGLQDDDPSPGGGGDGIGAGIVAIFGALGNVFTGLGGGSGNPALAHLTVNNGFGSTNEFGVAPTYFVNSYMYVGAGPSFAADAAASTAAVIFPLYTFYIESSALGAPSNRRRVFLPPNALTCTGMGRQFYAPSGYNLSNVVAAGSAGGKLNIFAMNRAVGHFGTFDYQRAGTPSSFTFYKGLTPVSNMDVGAYLYGAGFTQSQAGTVSNIFADLFSSNAGDPNQAIYRNFGYQLAASGGSYTCSAIPQ